MIETALITGAKRVGQVVARKIASAGDVNIATTYNTSEQEVKELVAAVKKTGARAAAFRIDLTQADQIEPLVRDIEAQLGPIVYFIHMASVFEKGDPQTTTQEQLDRSLAIHFQSAERLLEALEQRWLQRKQKGKVVLITDRIVAPEGRPYAGYYPYFKGKEKLQAAVRPWAKRLMPHGITVNAVAPGATKKPPDISDAEWAGLRRGILPGITDEAMMEQVAEAVSFFLGADFITGQTIVVDGGQNLI